LGGRLVLHTGEGCDEGKKNVQTSKACPLALMKQSVRGKNHGGRAQKKRSHC
jgi:hypothetical protein